MQYVRLYAGPDGESHFATVDVSLAEATYAPPALPVQVSAPTPARQSVFAAVPAGWDGGRHPSPYRQWGIVLTGELEIEVSDGEVRRFTADPSGARIAQQFPGFHPASRHLSIGGRICPL